jgi:DNA-binding MarR family transcriptional regulator
VSNLQDNFFRIVIEFRFVMRNLKSTGNERRCQLTGAHTLRETERQVDERLSGMQIDFQAMAVTSNLFRAATAVRNHLERSVLAVHELSWSAFVVFWVVWIWDEIETRDIATEAGFSKATLTGVLNTLEKRGLTTRKRSPEDGRLMLVKLTNHGRKLMEQLFPLFNKEEQFMASAIASAEQAEVAEALRKITEKSNQAN